MQTAECMQTNAEPEFSREIFEQEACRSFEPELTDKVLLYRYRHHQQPWTLCIATRGEAGSGKLSLGGFRIVPEARAALAGFSPEKEAIGLACGMEEKVFWSRLIRVGGPLGIKNLDRVVGGKCVLLPAKGARVGEPRDREILHFAISALADFEGHSGIFLTTGQDLGHGVMSDGRTTSLGYLNENFHGSVRADTSEPTAEGNLYSLLGMLKGAGIDARKAQLGLIGFGNIGRHLLDRLVETLGAEVLARTAVVEAVPEKRAALSQKGVRVFSPEQKAEMLKLPIDALICNANGSTLDSRTVDQIIANPKLKIICGCENLVMPDHRDAERLRVAARLYCPMELCGMMGYLTAVEEYLSKKAGRDLSMPSMLEAAKVLEPACERAARRAQAGAGKLSFEAAMRAEFGC